MCASLLDISKDTELLPHYDDEAGGSEQPMKQLKPRDKITQKMTRDGAVEINETQQTAERISSREADSDFSQPDTATAERVMEHLDAAHTSESVLRGSQEAQRLFFAYFHFPLAVYRRGIRKRRTATPTSKNQKSSRQTGRSKGSSPGNRKTGKRAHFEETTAQRPVYALREQES